MELFATISKIASTAFLKLFPVLKKTQLKEQVSSVREKLNSKNIPAYQEAANLLGNRHFKSKELQVMDKQVREALSRTVKGFDSRVNMVYAIKTILEGSNEFLNALSSSVDKLFADANPTGSLKLRQAYMITLVNNAAFVRKYSMMLLNYIYACEMNAVASSDEYSLVRAYKDKVEKDFNSFLRSIQILNIKSSELAKSLERISEYAEADNDSLQAIVATQPMSDLDPLKLGYLTSLSPFYIIGMWEAEIRAWFVRETEDEIELLTRRRIRLEQLYEGKNDALADKEIDLIQRRIDSNQADMDDYKRRYGF